jgi:hypothetical protein
MHTDSTAVYISEYVNILASNWLYGITFYDVFYFQIITFYILFYNYQLSCFKNQILYLVGKKFEKYLTNKNCKLYYLILLLVVNLNIFAEKQNVSQILHQQKLNLSVFFTPGNLLKLKLRLSIV